MTLDSLIFTEKILGSGNNGDVVEGVYNGNHVAIKRVNRKKHLMERDIMINYRSL